MAETGQAFDWPELDWPPAAQEGRLVQLLLPGGATPIGRLVRAGTEPGEDAGIPIWEVRDQAGRAYALAAATAWRWVGF